VGAIIISTTLDHLKRSEELFNTGKYAKAYALISNFGSKRKLTLHDVISSQLLKLELLFQQGRYKEVLSCAKRICKYSKKLYNNPLRVDSLIWTARALIFLNKLDEAYDQIIKAEEILQSLSDKTSLAYVKSKGFIAFVKGYFYHVKGEVDKSIENLNQSVSLREIVGSKHEISESLCWLAVDLIIHKGQLNSAEESAERSLILAKQSAKKFYIAFSLTSLATCYYWKGNINKCIPLFEKSLAIFRELNNKRMIAITLNNVGEKYRMKGDLDRALAYLEESANIFLDLGNLRDIANIYDFLIQILIEKGNFEQARAYLGKLKQLESKLKDEEINHTYLFLNALLLKKSLRIRNIAKAEEILKCLLEEKSSYYELTINTLINLCELYIQELRTFNNSEVLKDIDPLIIQLLYIAKKSKSYWILSETYLLQAKVSLLRFEINKARSFLNKAQEIAESYGLERLAINISLEHDNLVHRLKLWQELKKTNASVSERLNLSGLNQQIDIMLKRSAIEIPNLLDEQPVFLFMISRNGRPIFTQSFIKNKLKEEHLFGGFFTAFYSFMNNIFSEGLDRASFGEYTLLIKEVQSFLLCYIYKGQSYSALNRIKALIEQIHQKELNDAFLNSIVNKIFISKIIPS